MGVWLRVAWCVAGEWPIGEIKERTTITGLSHRGDNNTERQTLSPTHNTTMKVGS